ncbi:MAG: preprotein translocase subunit SecG [Proteobacteria bacterium]|nr:preprotein translocase subunit SecG [Pseudomonadota bacterium]
MLTVIVVIHLVIVMSMVGLVLIQRSEGGGLGMGGGTGGFLSSRGTANVLTRSTAMLAAAFFVTSLALSILAGWDRRPRSILQNTGAPTQQTAPGAPAPLGGTGGGVLDTLRGAPAQPAAPAPTGPQVPQSR